MGLSPPVGWGTGGIEAIGLKLRRRNGGCFENGLAELKVGGSVCVERKHPVSRGCLDDV